MPETKIMFPRSIPSPLPQSEINQTTNIAKSGSNFYNKYLQLLEVLEKLVSDIMNETSRNLMEVNFKLSKNFFRKSSQGWAWGVDD